MKILSTKNVAGGLIGFFFLAVIIFFASNAGILPAWIPDMIYIIFPALAVLSGIFAVRGYGLKSGHGQSLLIMIIGISCWLLAEIIWLILDYIFHIQPFPSIADFFFIIAYPFIFWAIIKELINRKVTLTLYRELISLAVIITLGFMLGYTLYQNFISDSQTFSSMIGIGYGVGDFLLLAIFIYIIFLAFDYEGGKLFKAWLMMFLGLTSFFAADLLFAIYHELYDQRIFTYRLIDLVWIIGYLFLAYGFFNFWFLTKEMGEKIKRIGQEML